jgi:membrane-bound lytic murein transglycosylase B
MEFFQQLITNPFIMGLLLGLLIAGFIWKNSFAAKLLWKKEKKKHETELRELTGHLNTQLKINSSGNDVLQKELDQLRIQNETLRVNLAALQQKPGKAELRQLQITENAVSTMREQAPGFAQAWERAIRQAEEDYQAGESGLKKLIIKVIPSLGNGSVKSKSIVSEQDKTESI